MISVISLTKKFRQFVAVDDVNILFQKGKIYGLIGKNGAGKTTLLKMICGLMAPTKGNIIFEDKQPNIGLLIEAPGIFPSMTAFDNIKLKSLNCGIKLSKNDIYSLLQQVGLEDVGHKRCGNFSLGMKQRLGLALSLIGNPNLLILDEPTNGLDPSGILEFRNLLFALNKEYGTTMIISSHILDELSKVVTDYIIMDRGKVLLNSTKDEFEDQSHGIPLDEYYVNLIGDKNAVRN